MPSERQEGGGKRGQSAFWEGGAPVPEACRLGLVAWETLGLSRRPPGSSGLCSPHVSESWTSARHQYSLSHRAGQAPESVTSLNAYQLCALGSDLTISLSVLVCQTEVMIIIITVSGYCEK